MRWGSAIIGASLLLIGSANASESGERLSALEGPRLSNQEYVATQLAPSAFLLRGTASWHSEYIAGPQPAPIANASPPVDLLTRLRAGFTMEVGNEPRTMAQLRWYSRHPDYFNRVLTRARPYLHHIVESLQARDMPYELALLPIVESAFDPFAYSHGRAAGLWQFIPGTGRRFGLKQDWWYDGRRDVLESTRAALDYLEYLARRYDGDYELAVAAYNSGEGTVDRAIRRNKKAGKPTDFWSLKLPKETSAYVPKLLALAEIFTNPDYHGMALPIIPDLPQIAVVETGGQIDLALAAELAQIDVDTLYLHNPGYNQWATSPNGPHQLVVPIAAAETLSEALADLPLSERMRWTRHKVANGQTLSHIADRYAITTAAIRSANKLNGNMIRSGQYLMIPTATRPLTDYSQSVAQRIDRKQQRPRGGEKVEHIVGPGESLWTISRRYGVATRSLASWNGMAPRDTLSVGRKLVVWQQAEKIQSTRSATTRKLRYTVRSGDSLSVIAARFRVRVADIARWNKLDLQKILRPGQKLTMFVDVTRQSS